MRRIRLGVLALVLLGSGNAFALAITVDFDFTGGGPNGAVLVFNQSGAQVTVDALAEDPGLVFQTAEVTHAPAGLGVRNLNGPESSAQLDSLQNNERIRFALTALPAFGQRAFLQSITFSNGFVVNNDNFRFRMAGDLKGVFTPSGNPWDLTTQAGLTDADRVFGVGELFNLTVNQGGGTENFRIAGFSLLVVPEPATFALAAGGLLAIGAIRRRRRGDSR